MGTWTTLVLISLDDDWFAGTAVHLCRILNWQTCLNTAGDGAVMITQLFNGISLITFAKSFAH